VFLNFNNGEQIAFMPSDKITQFYTDYYRFFNESLKMSAEEIEAAKKRGRDEGFFGEEEEQTDFSKVSDTGLVFFNPKSGLEIATGINSAFPLLHNPYFDEAKSEDHLFVLMMNETISADLFKFCIEKCKDKLPFFKTETGMMYMNDIDFLLRFWKLANYFARPNITQIGSGKNE
jgi:hypothetical protein